MVHTINPERMANRLQLVRDHLRRVNGHDLDGLLATFGPEAALAINGDRHAGRDGIRGLFWMLFGDFPDLRLSLERHYLADSAVVGELVLRASQGRPARGPTAGRLLAIPVCGLFHFGDEERLAEVAYYFDGATLLREPAGLRRAA